MLLLHHHKRLGRTLIGVEAGRGLIALVLFELEGSLTALALLEARVTFPRCSGHVSSRCRELLTLEA
jgi:hypothetical protein